MKQHSTKSINLYLFNPRYAHGIILDAMAYAQFLYMQVHTHTHTSDKKNNSKLNGKLLSLHGDNNSFLTALWGWGCHCSVSKLSDSLGTHGLQHARFPYPSLSPTLLQFMSFESGMLSNHLILWHLLLLLSSIFLSIRVFPNSLHQVAKSIGASAPVLPMNTQDGFPLGLTGLIFLPSSALSRVFSNTTFGGWGVGIKWKAKYFRAPDKLGLDSLLCCL